MATDIIIHDKKDNVGVVVIEKITPKNKPRIEPINPIEIPTVKKILTILWLDIPIVFNIPISLFFSLTNIIKPDIIFNEATRIIKDKIINITFFSTFKAFINV